MNKVLGIFTLGVLLVLLLTRNFGSTLKTKTVLINNHQIIVEVADTDSLRTQGLSGRKILPKDYGMLFIFPSASYYRFWMKDMKIPLDFIWIDKDKVVDLTENVAIPKSDDLKDLPTFSSRYPVDKILEVNVGTIKALNISIGNDVK